ncbi:MAG: sugar nucleotide-binding protein [Acidobacteria bacterium]|nr:sugar nucleotide-binding protein [Acidobacteriota bacterium]
MPATSSTQATVIIGADSLIGVRLMRQMQRLGARVIGTSRRRDALDDSHVHLDLAEDVGEWVSPVPASVAVICASVTRLDACERDPAGTARVNVQGVHAVAKNLIKAGARVIYLSSNAVFDGSAPNRKTDERVSPVTEYGRQKVEVEKLLLSPGSEVSIVRLTKVLESRAGLLRGWAETLRAGQVIHPFRDMVMAPLPLSFVTDVLARLIEKPLPGILHVSAERDVTYADAARHIAQRLGVGGELVQPVSFRDAGLPEQAVPAHTTLDAARLNLELGMRAPDVWETIDAASGL